MSQYQPKRVQLVLATSVTALVGCGVIPPALEPITLKNLKRGDSSQFIDNRIPPTRDSQSSGSPLPGYEQSLIKMPPTQILAGIKEKEFTNFKSEKSIAITQFTVSANAAKRIPMLANRGGVIPVFVPYGASPYAVIGGLVLANALISAARGSVHKQIQTNISLSQDDYVFVGTADSPCKVDCNSEVEATIQLAGKEALGNLYELRPNIYLPRPDGSVANVGKLVPIIAQSSEKLNKLETLLTSNALPEGSKNNWSHFEEETFSRETVVRTEKGLLTHAIAISAFRAGSDPAETLEQYLQKLPQSKSEQQGTAQRKVFRTQPIDPSNAKDCVEYVGSGEDVILDQNGNPKQRGYSSVMRLCKLDGQTDGLYLRTTTSFVITHKGNVSESSNAARQLLDLTWPTLIGN